MTFRKGTALAVPYKHFIFVIPHGLQAEGNLLFRSFPQAVKQ